MTKESKVNTTTQQEKLKLSTKVGNLAALCHDREITFNILIDQLKDQGNALGSVFLSLPFLLPIPVPGLSCLFGLGIAIVGLRMTLGKGPWFPKKYAQKKFSGQVFFKLLIMGEKLLRRVEVFTKPRMKIFCLHPWFRTWNGLLIAFCGLFLAAPLPPGTNFPPASVILSLSIGTLEEDGLWILLGYILFLLNIIFFSVISVLGFEGIKLFFNAGP